MTTYIFGHKNPDTDSICSAIAYADFKTKNGEKNILAARIGDINNETKFVLDKFDISAPKLLTDGTDKKMILVDHNQETQSINNRDKGEVVEVLDHHNINFQSAGTIPFIADAVGATATILATMYFETKTPLDKKIAGLLLSAIISDTVIFKSPTTTDKDKTMAKKLAPIAEIKDLNAFGIEMFKAKSVWGDMNSADIIEMDRKEYDMSGTKISITQVETVDYTDLVPRKKELLDELLRLKELRDMNLSVLLITDIIKEGCLLLAVGDTGKIEKAYNKKLENCEMWLDGVLSRKKQVVPLLEKVF
ncbi:manganese-dependent inorganic pyrophosphatase [archaeon]|nr:manganese-dependent inorganic pyrophosphatase [archaeon]